MKDFSIVLEKTIKEIDSNQNLIVSEINKEGEELVNLMLKKHLKSTLAYLKLVAIAEVLNEGWQPNWKDSNEQKWFPCFVFVAGFVSTLRFTTSTVRIRMSAPVSALKRKRWLNMLGSNSKTNTENIC